MNHERTALPIRDGSSLPGGTGITRRSGGSAVALSAAGIDAVIRGCVAGRRLDGPTLERILFALVASRTLAPSSKLAAAGWVGADVPIDGLATVSDDACYRAMDELHAMEGDFGTKVHDNLASLLNLEADLLSSLSG